MPFNPRPDVEPGRRCKEDARTKHKAILNSAEAACRREVLSNLTTVGGPGSPLFRLTDYQPPVPTNAVFWLDQSTLLVACAGQAPFWIDTQSGHAGFHGGYPWGPNSGPTGPQTALVAVIR
jgi:hypothetical protein